MANEYLKFTSKWLKKCIIYYYIECLNPRLVRIADRENWICDKGSYKLNTYSYVAD